MSKITITNVPHEFEKGTIADSVEVNENFNNVVEQLSSVNDSVDNLFTEVSDTITTKFDNILGATYEDDALKETSLDRNSSSIVAWINTKMNDINAIVSTLKDEENELGSKTEVVTSGELGNNDIFIATNTEKDSSSADTRAEDCNCLIRKSTTKTVTLTESFDFNAYHYNIEKLYKTVQISSESSENLESTEENTLQQEIFSKEINGRIPAGLFKYNGNTVLNFTINLPVEFYQDGNGNTDINSLFNANIYAHQKLATETDKAEGTATYTKHNTVNATVKYAVLGDGIDCSCIKGSVTLAKGYNLFDLYFSVKGGALNV